MKKIIIGADHAGFKLKEKLKSFLARKGFDLCDVGTFSLDSCDYPDFVCALADKVCRGKYKQGILICKSGIGSSIAANKFPGVRAALCYNLKAAKLSREHNDSNVLVLGSAFVSFDLARRITTAWLNTDFTKGRHKRRLNKIRKIERHLTKKRR